MLKIPEPPKKSKPEPSTAKKAALEKIKQTNMEDMKILEVYFDKIR